jgi:hypothetical protein
MEVVPNDSNNNEDEKKEYDSECDICDVSSDENDDNVDRDENEPVGLSDLDFIANSVGEGEVLWSSQTGKSENGRECSINNDENALIIVDTNGHMSEEDKNEAGSDNENENENENEVESSDEDSDTEDVIDIKRRTKESKLAHKWYIVRIYLIFYSI